jgi:LysM repeat protein
MKNKISLATWVVFLMVSIMACADPESGSNISSAALVADSLGSVPSPTIEKSTSPLKINEEYPVYSPLAKDSSEMTPAEKAKLLYEELEAHVKKYGLPLPPKIEGAATILTEKAGSVKDSLTEKAPKSPTARASCPCEKKYTIHAGSSAWGVAKQNQMTVEYLRSINKVINGKNVTDSWRVGTIICLKRGKC